MTDQMIPQGGFWRPGDGPLFDRRVEHLKIEFRTANTLTISHWWRHRPDTP